MYPYSAKETLKLFGFEDLDIDVNKMLKEISEISSLQKYSTLEEKIYFWLFEHSELEVRYMSYPDDVISLQKTLAKANYYFDFWTVYSIWSKYSDMLCAGWIGGAKEVDFKDEKFITYLINLQSKA